MSARKAKHTLLYQPNRSLDGHSFRAISDGSTVKIQERNPDESKYVTARTISKEDWDAFASSNDLYNPYNDNPSHIAKLVQSDRNEGRI